MPQFAVVTIVTALSVCSGSVHALLDPVQTSWTPASTAGEVPSGILRFELLDEDGKPCAARLTFVGEDGGRPQLFANTQAAPDQLAVRRNIVYSISGRGAITVPEGTYTVWVSKGMEYSVDSRTIRFTAGEEAIWTPKLKRAVDTTGWISGDFHLHTLTHSGHGDSNMPERVISLIGEGVEFAVATDHNHNTDYDPTMQHLGVPDALRAVVGNEVSTPIGHFNAFPLDSESPIIESEQYDANELFRVIREQSNEFGTVPVVQVNHPRWGGIDYFGQFELDPVHATSASEGFSYDFDSVEIFNENEGWGYIDADESELSIGSGSFSVLRDWFNILNRGYRVAAVGNSDSHDVESELAGWPRNFVASSTDIPSEIKPAEIAANIRAKRVYTSYGPIVDFAVNGVQMGGDATALRTQGDSGWANIDMRVQVPEWMSCDRLLIVVNGEIVRTIDVSDRTGTIRYDGTEQIQLTGDSWVSLLVEGDEPLAPIVHDQGRPIYPWAVLNPVWVDVDSDGRWISPLQQARQKLAAKNTLEMLRDMTEASEAQWVNAMVACVESEVFHSALIERGFSHESRQVRLAAAGAVNVQLRRLAEVDPSSFQMAASQWKGRLKDVFALAGEDQHLRMRVLLALDAAGDPMVERYAFNLLTNENERAKLRKGFESVLRQVLGGAMVKDWSIASYFDAPEFGTLEFSLTPAEINPTASSFAGGKSGEQVSWQEVNANGNGYVDLLGLNESEDVTTNAISTARIWFQSDGSPLAYAFGADDASRVLLNGQAIYEDHNSHSADPMQHIGQMVPQDGMNLLTVSVENGSGGYGFYLRFFNDDVLRTVTPFEPSTLSEGRR